MRVAILAAAASLALAGPSLAAAPGGQPTMKSCAAQWQEMKKAGTAKGSYRDFSKTCLAGKPAARTRTPAQSRMLQIGPTSSATAAAPPKGAAAEAAGATARCKDGSYSHAKTHSGACSRHGGVAQWLK